MNLFTFFQFGTINPPAEILRFGGTEAGLSKFLGVIITLLFIVAAIASFIMLLVAGIQWTTSGGDQKAVEAARGRATAAIIGLVLTLSAFAIIKLVETILGVPIVSGGIHLPGP